MSYKATCGIELDQLSAGDAEPVLVADFQTFSTEPRLGALLADGSRGRPVYQVDPLTALTGSRVYFSLPELAQACADRFRSLNSDAAPMFVVGYCSAAAMALHVAKLLEPQREVTVILVQPSWPGEKDIQARLAEYMASMGAANSSCSELGGDPCRAIARLEQAMRVRLEAVAAANGLDGSAPFGDLLARYRSWLAFLLACRNDSSESRAPGTSTVKILTDEPAAAEGSGLRPGIYHVCQLPAGDHQYSVADLAGYVSALMQAR